MTADDFLQSLVVHPYLDTSYLAVPSEVIEAFSVCWCWLLLLLLAWLLCDDRLVVLGSFLLVVVVVVVAALVLVAVVATSPCSFFWCEWLRSVVMGKLFPR